MNHSEIILYKTENGAIKINTILKNETIRLTQKKMAEERYEAFDKKIAEAKVKE